MWVPCSPMRGLRRLNSGSPLPYSLPMRSFATILSKSLFLSALLTCTQLAFAAELQAPGYRPKPLGVHALVGARVVIRPGEVLEPGTIIIVMVLSPT